MTVTSSTQRVADAAERLGLRVEIREFPKGTRTAEDAANAIGVSVGQIVKSLVFTADGSPVVCLTSGSNRLDTTKLATAIGAKRVDRADADTARDATGFAVGGIPPFGHDSDIRIYCDRDLLSYDVIWAAAGTPMAVFSVAPDDLVAACEAEVLDLKEE